MQDFVLSLLQCENVVLALLSILFIVHCSLFIVIVNVQCCNNIVCGLVLRCWPLSKFELFCMI